MSKSSIWPIDRSLLGATTPGQSGPGSDGNKVVLSILQSSNITGAYPSDHIRDTHWKVRGPMQRCNLYILQTQPTG